MNSILSFLISALIGTTVIVNGVALSSEEILNETKGVVDEANIHQIETALEVYYINKSHYPLVSSGDDMLAELLSTGYLRRVSDNIATFSYDATNQGETYSLSY